MTTPAPDEQPTRATAPNQANAHDHAGSTPKNESDTAATIPAHNTPPSSPTQPTVPMHGSDSHAQTVTAATHLHVDATLISKPSGSGSHNGEVWGDFSLGKLLGRGGMGAVYSGRQISLDRPVAIKLLSEHLSDNEDFRKRFLLEARAAARINSPHVVQVYFAGSHTTENGMDVHFFAMEYVEGTDLAQKLKKDGPLSQDQCINYIKQATQSLTALAEHNIVHRDIKPANFMLTDRGQLKLMDFGLVKFASESHGLTQTGTVMGTVNYFSPEQGRGEVCDQRTDIYALGVMFYEMLTGKLPFTGGDATSVIYQHIHAEPKPPRIHNPTVTEPYQSVVLKCLEKDPDDRYLQAADLLADLQRIERGVKPTALLMLPKRKGKVAPVVPDNNKQRLIIAAAVILAAIILSLAIIFKAPNADEAPLVAATAEADPLPADKPVAPALTTPDKVEPDVVTPSKQNILVPAVPKTPDNGTTPALTPNSNPLTPIEKPVGEKPVVEKPPALSIDTTKPANISPTVIVPDTPSPVKSNTPEPIVLPKSDNPPVLVDKTVTNKDPVTLATTPASSTIVAPVVPTPPVAKPPVAPEPVVVDKPQPVKEPLIAQPTPPPVPQKPVTNPVSKPTPPTPPTQPIAKPIPPSLAYSTAVQTTVRVSIPKDHPLLSGTTYLWWITGPVGASGRLGARSTMTPDNTWTAPALVSEATLNVAAVGNQHILKIPLRATDAPLTATTTLGVFARASFQNERRLQNLHRDYDGSWWNVDVQESLINRMSTSWLQSDRAVLTPKPGTPIALALRPQHIAVLDLDKKALIVYNRDGTTHRTITGLQKPTDIISGPNNSWFVADQKAGGIFVYNTDGVRTATLARTSPGATGFTLLTKLATDGTLVYALDAQAKNIFVFDGDQVVATWVLDSGDRPVGMAYHDKFVFVLMQNGMVRAIDKRGDVARVIQPATTRLPGEELGYAADIAIDTTGEIYVTYPDREMIARHAGVGDVALRHARTWTWRAYAADAAGHLYCLNRDNNRIVILDEDGWRSRPMVPTPDKKLRFDSPTFIAAQPNGAAVAIYDEDNYKVTRLDLTNNSHVTFGGEGSKDGQFNATAGLAMDEAGRTFVLDTGNRHVAVFDPVGQFIMNVGRYERGDKVDMLRIPRAFCVSPDGTQFFIFDEESLMIKHFAVDYDTKQIRHVRNMGGAKAHPGMFLRVTGMGCDRRGRLYVMDYKRGDLQVFDTAADEAKLITVVKGTDFDIRRMLYLALNPDGLVFIVGGDQLTGLHWKP